MLSFLFIAILSIQSGWACTTFVIKGSDLIDRSFRKTRFLSNIPKERLDALARFPERFTCP